MRPDSPSRLAAIFAALLALLLCLALSGCSDDESSDPAAGSDARSPLQPGDAPASELVVELEAVLANEDLPIGNRVGAAMAIGSLGSAEGTAPLVRAFGYREPEIVIAAVESLPDTRDEDAIEALRELATSHSNRGVRSAAKKRLKRMN